MTAQIFEFPIKVSVIEPKDTPFDALQDILPAVPASEIELLLSKLWVRGFKIVPVDLGDDDE